MWRNLREKLGGFVITFLLLFSVPISVLVGTFDAWRNGWYLDMYPFVSISGWGYWALVDPLVLSLFGWLFYEYWKDVR